MILIGQYDSPFVRRVGIALRLYDISFEHWPWSGFGDADKIQAYNPLIRVPTLILDDGEVLIESHAMLDYLDSLVPAGRAMFPALEPARHKALKLAALASGLADKAVSLFYEKRLHTELSEVWVSRCQSQIAAAMTALEADRAGKTTRFWLGDDISHVDIVVTTALRFITDAHPGLVSMAMYPALAAHTAMTEALPVFQEIQQEFIPPA
jgi:glutathione S-transferase